MILVVFLAGLQELEASVIAAPPEAILVVCSHAVAIAKLAEADGGQVVGRLLTLASVMKFVARLLERSRA